MVSEAFIKYTAYLGLLHCAQKMGQDEGDDSKGDQIRNAMDPFWYAMTEAEMKLAGQISEAMYVLDGKPNPADR